MKFMLHKNLVLRRVILLSMFSLISFGAYSMRTPETPKKMKQRVFSPRTPESGRRKYYNPTLDSKEKHRNSKNRNNFGGHGFKPNVCMKLFGNLTVEDKQDRLATGGFNPQLQQDLKKQQILNEVLANSIEQFMNVNPYNSEYNEKRRYYMERIRKLLQKGAKINDVASVSGLNSKGYSDEPFSTTGGFSPIERALRKFDVECLVRLLSLGAKVEDEANCWGILLDPNAYHWRTLDRDTIRKIIQCIKILLQNNQINVNCHIEHEDGSITTPLIEAINSGSRDVVSVLLNYGADISQEYRGKSLFQWVKDLFNADKSKY